MVKKNGTKFPEENQQDFPSSQRKAPGPKSPTEATTAPTSPPYYRNMDVTITYEKNENENRAGFFFLRQLLTGII
ncbi:hypothetical protein Phum_PHUM474060 [Pediculus humanus corporis]|uniref:Uncharacterized protein n=1 Tax=Pediculus humanus subsp. corporis TaxID=121224 RepID=E0VW47_PEDHC|nr:uncharacterized protein Phum_PHUM474060 [Pediculus humanus corporis]EEB17603.1 hypothetical protein Phum_PHUM474060 [Pediculus humanus corporis]